LQQQLHSLTLIKIKMKKVTKIFTAFLISASLAIASPAVAQGTTDNTTTTTTADTDRDDSDGGKWGLAGLLGLLGLLGLKRRDDNNNNTTRKS
jgi:MYXO-CTERM domain-containing protein